MFSNSIRKLLLVFAALLFIGDSAAACTCRGPRQIDGFHPCITYSRADAVFTGQVVGVSFAQLDPDGKPVPFSQKIFHFAVDEAFRGVEGRTVEVITNPNTASCGYDFVQGQRYFVYARRKGDGKLTEGLCGPTVPLDAAARDLAYAREMMRGEKGVRIVGAVIKYERGLLTRTRVPLTAVEVILERVDPGEERFSTTVTNSEGAYEFRGLSPGTYHVRTALPTGLVEWSRGRKPKVDSVSLSERTGCGFKSFIFTTTSN